MSQAYDRPAPLLAAPDAVAPDVPPDRHVVGWDDTGSGPYLYAGYDGNSVVGGIGLQSAQDRVTDNGVNGPHADVRIGEWQSDDGVETEGIEAHGDVLDGHLHDDPGSSIGLSGSIGAADLAATRNDAGGFAFDAGVAPLQGQARVGSEDGAHAEIGAAGGIGSPFSASTDGNGHGDFSVGSKDSLFSVGVGF